ncbi:ATP-binding protein [Marinihelvus fidelis]|uniref:ATP-binding protein n=1 Tax=Marinihelvus fidelis TaxID=2613842 RepID=A0A5N0TFD8_9GAMM|nr:ATP-binding protein [Marinihelvus fidelis]KAA9133331.1 ATP-binding protein [Marinihelvus fidelis]
MTTAAFARDVESLAGIVAMTADFFSRHAIPAGLRQAVDLCLEELFVNMVRYNTETDRPIEIELRAVDGGVTATLTDHDVERFDPARISAVDIHAPIEEREPGGLGLYLVFKMADSVHYEYRARTSKITFVIEGKQA